MTYRVLIVEDAELDILDIYTYIAESESLEQAESILNELETRIHSLAEFQERGHVPPELQRVGIYEYREIHLHAWRILYRVQQSNVVVHCILDGRRDLQEILERRLLR